MINRNLQSHSQYLELILSDKTGWHYTTYGINGPSILSNLKHFDITMCLPYDIMHSIFEGITVVHLNQVRLIVGDLRYIARKCTKASLFTCCSHPSLLYIISYYGRIGSGD